MKSLKIILGVIFILAIAFFVARGCVPKRVAAPETKKIKRLLPSVPVISGPRMAIILDDWGNNLSLVQDAVDIRRPLTLSVLPHLAHSQEIAEQAFKNNLGVMLHMPMQPKNGREILEPHTIMVTSSDMEIMRYLDEALAGIPHIEGVNNHMGSAATSDARVMRVFLNHLKQTHLFFIDSNTDRSSVAFKTAEDLGLPCAKREVFLDNETKPASIRKQILLAKKIALKKGQVVVIGHDKKVTLQVIKEMISEIEKDGVRLVLVRDILK